MAFVDADLIEVGTNLEVDLRGTAVGAVVEPLPFLRAVAKV
jgi:glycine cleavage system aminomethyltransferase T